MIPFLLRIACATCLLVGAGFQGSSALREAVSSHGLLSLSVAKSVSRVLRAVEFSTAGLLIASLYFEAIAPEVALGAGTLVAVLGVYVIGVLVPRDPRPLAVRCGCSAFDERLSWFTAIRLAVLVVLSLGAGGSSARFEYWPNRVSTALAGISLGLLLMTIPSALKTPNVETA
jgi:hypothetical protein